MAAQPVLADFSGGTIALSSGKRRDLERDANACLVAPLPDPQLFSFRPPPLALPGSDFKR